MNSPAQADPFPARAAGGNFRKLAVATISFASVTFLACGHTSAPPQARPQSSTAAMRMSHNPPIPKDVIDAVISNGAIDLSVSPSCRSVGTEPTDRNISRYVAGFLAELSKPDGKNWIQTDVEPGTSDGDAIWLCKMMIRHVDGDDRWGWGVQFNVRRSDGLVIAPSFTCVGGG